MKVTIYGAGYVGLVTVAAAGIEYHAIGRPVALVLGDSGES